MKQRTILITGASSGIGLASARLMKARGWRVLATARTPEALAVLEKEVGVEALRLDLSSEPASVAACAEEALRRTERPPLRALQQCRVRAGRRGRGSFSRCARRQIEVNVIATHELTRRLLPAMREQGEGRIVQCSSVLGFVSAQYRGAYRASKFALEALSDAMRQELAGTDIRVSIIEPGPIRTRFVETALANFRTTVDIEGSPHREAYLARWLPWSRAANKPSSSSRKLSPGSSCTRSKARDPRRATW